MSRLPTRPVSLFLIAVVALFTAHCGGGSPPTQPTSTSPPTTTGTTATTTTTSGAAVAYVQDVKPILDADCLRCHSTSSPAAGISVSSFSAVMRMVTPGSAASQLVTSTQVSPRGSMNRYLTGDVSGKADVIRRWVVENGAVENR